LKTFNAKIKNMDLAMWNYVKLVAKKENITTAGLFHGMIEAHAVSTGRKNLLDTLKEEYK
jgi:hypothetical protein